MAARMAIRSLRDPQKNSQATLDHYQCVGINAPEDAPHLVTPHGHGLVDHDLRGLFQTIDLVRLKGDPQQRRLNKCAGHGQDGNARMLVELIGLDHQGGPRFPVVALHDDGYEVAAP